MLPVGSRRWGPSSLRLNERFVIERRKVDAAVSSLQLVLARGDEAVRDWLVMTDIIAAVDEIAP